MNFQIDKKFTDFYGRNLKQVFLYLVDDCNLRCEQCLYKLEIAFQVKKKQIDFEDAIKLLEDFREMGAIKLTLIGGEPTLYDIENNNEKLLKIINIAKQIGYEHVRIDTNGQFDSKLLDEPEFKMLDEITFSIDGPTAEINDPIRGYGSFDRCVANIKKAKELGYNIDITSCISKELAKRDENGNLYLDRMIKFAEELGIEKMNFHNLFKTGTPRDYFTGNLDISIKKWFDVWNEIENKIENKEYSIPVRIPQSFTTKKEFNSNPEYYGYCSCKTRSRILVHANGMLRICALMIGTPNGIAKYYDNKIVWDASPTNELGDHKFDENTPCTNQSKHNKFGQYVPVCISFKAGQNEVVWNALNWENKKLNTKIRTVIVYDEITMRKQLEEFLGKIDEVEIVGVAENTKEAIDKIVGLEPEMVFSKYQFDENMNTFDILKQSKEKLNENIPIFNLIVDTVTLEDSKQVHNVIGNKLNTFISNKDGQARYDGIIQDYKSYYKEILKINRW